MKQTIVEVEGRLTPLLAALVVAAAGPRVLVLALDPVGVDATGAMGAGLDDESAIVLIDGEGETQCP